MIRKFSFISGAVLAVLFLGGLFAADAQVRHKPAPKPAPVPAPAPTPNPLIQMLPDSDAVIAFNAQKFLSTALPQILGQGSPVMTMVNTELSKFKLQTGLDARQIEMAAVGLKYKEISPAVVDIDPVVLINGKFNVPGLVALLKIGLSGKFREEQAGGRSIYVFPVKDLIPEKEQKDVDAAVAKKAAEMKFRTIHGELAIGVLDDNTLAIGSLGRLQETFEHTSSLDADLGAMVKVKPNALVSFAGKMPGGLAAMLGLGNDEMGKMIDSMRFTSGYMDMTGANTSLMLATKTTTPDEAASIENTVIGLKEVGKAFVGGVKGVEKAVYLRLLNNAKVVRLENQVQLNLLISQADINILSKKIK